MRGRTASKSVQCYEQWTASSENRFTRTASDPAHDGMGNSPQGYPDTAVGGSRVARRTTVQRYSSDPSLSIAI
jgi:hypothetical protein